MPEEKDKIKLMYDAMSGSIELGTPQQFEEALKDKTKRNLIFQNQILYHQNLMYHHHHQI